MLISKKKLIKDLETSIKAVESLIGINLQSEDKEDVKKFLLQGRDALYLAKSVYEDAFEDNIKLSI